MAGLQASCSRHLAQKRIAVGLRDGRSGAECLAPGELLLAIEFAVKVWEIPDRALGDSREIVRGHMLGRIGPAIGIGENRIGDADLPRRAVHDVGKAASVPATPSANATQAYFPERVTIHC